MTKALDYAETLLACLEIAYAENAPEETPGQLCLRHGLQVVPVLGAATDECCAGLGYVRIVRVEPLLTQDDVAAACFASRRRIVLEMGVFRCLPWGSVNDPTTCDQWTAVATLADLDHDMMERALCCLRDSVGSAFNILLGQYEPYGPDGNCTGGQMTVTVEADCGC